MPRQELCGAATLGRLVQLLASPRHSLAQPAARVLARTCTSTAQQDAALDAGAVPALMQLLQSGKRGQQEAAVAALAAITDGNKQVGVFHLIVYDLMTHRLQEAHTRHLHTLWCSGLDLTLLDHRA